MATLLRHLSVAAIAAMFVSTAFAQDQPQRPRRSEEPTASARGSSETEQNEKSTPIPAETKSETQHTWSAGSRTVHYTATAGNLLIRDDDDKPNGSIFYVAYTEDGADKHTRPVTFLYNGGPGSATIWLHMGSVGPVRVVTASPEASGPAPFKWVDNQYSLLDKTDLVFIDAPLCGFSRAVGKGTVKDFAGVDQDIKAFNKFITRYITVNQRWNSPKYLFGESYGTTRSSVVSNILENEKSIDLNGVILLSQIFNFTSDIDEARTNPGIDLPFQLALPTFAATAYYHHKLPNPPAVLQPFLKEVEDFSMGEYAHALAQGTDLSAGEEQAVAEKLHNYTGLPVSYLIKADLRVSGGGFEKNLQGDEDLTTGRLDTRFSGPTINPLSEEAEYDPQSSAISSAYVSLFNDYVRRDLKYGAGQTYLPMAEFGSAQWDLKHNGNPINLNVSADLATAMKTNPRLKVMVNGGYYDLATPFYSAYYEDKHLPIPENLAKNIEFDWYESGHMVYVHEESLKKLHDRVAAFVRSTDEGNQ